MNAAKEQKPSHQRNITPNFLRFQKKSASKNAKVEEGAESQYPTERSGSKASRGSMDIYEKRMLHLSKLKNTGVLKEKDGSVEPSKKKREGLEVTSRKNSASKKEEEQQQTRASGIGIGIRKTSNSSSNKNLKITIISSRERDQRTSNPKRTEDSLQREDERAKQSNKQFFNALKQQQIVPNYMSRLKIKKVEQKQKSKSTIPKKFLNVSFEIKNEQQLKNYQIYQQLGKGAYGVVKMGISKRSNQKVAIKIYEKKRLDEPNKLKNLQREINILSKLDHPVIAKLIDVIQSSTEIYLIQEYGGANSLYNYLLSKPQHRLQESEAKQVFKTIAQTLQYLHERHIVHRDIKAENILLNRNKQLKLIDFGFSLESTPPNTIDTFCGTPTYMAPQIVSKRDHVPTYTDLWSLGVFLFVILQGNYPFRAKNQNDLFDKIKKGQFQYIHKDISDKSRQVIQKLITLNPLQRMPTQQMNQAFWQWYLPQSVAYSSQFTGLTTTCTN